MELKKTFDFRKIVIVSYFVLLAVYLVVGLLPAGATSVDIITDIEEDFSNNGLVYFKNHEPLKEWQWKEKCIHPMHLRHQGHPIHLFRM